jgi:branched-chain amino acid aminotransferase
VVDFAVYRSETPLPAAEREAVLAAAGFGEPFTDHMAIARWSRERG